MVGVGESVECFRLQVKEYPNLNRLKMMRKWSHVTKALRQGAHRLTNSAVQSCHRL